jgi:Holliday junction resolvase-like predicted endonuclease
MWHRSCYIRIVNGGNKMYTIEVKMKSTGNWKRVHERINFTKLSLAQSFAEHWVAGGYEVRITEVN